MQLEEIQNFIYKCCGKNIPVRFVDPKLKIWNFLSGYPAWVSPKTEIIINQDIWNECNDQIKQYVILHEIGHVEDPSGYYYSVVHKELFAQTYAIKKAESLGMVNLVKVLKYILSQWEFQFKWNSQYRKYILASRLAKKRGIVV
jgi:hypothetical protein